jgi:lysophospholipase L1-like esterase
MSGAGDEYADRAEDGGWSRRRALVAVLTLLLSGLVGVYLVDLGVAWWDRDQGADGGIRAIMRHEQLGWVGRPHFENPEFGTTLDRFGLRNPEIPADAPREELRIAGFGASRIYGAGGALQEWCWNYALEEGLARVADVPVRVLNGGVMGYSALQACRRAALMLDSLEPDLVFVAVSPRAQLLLDPSAARNWVRFGDEPDALVPADVVEGWPEGLLPLVARGHRLLNATSAIYRRHRAKFQVGGDRDVAIQQWILSRREDPPEVRAMLEATLREADALAGACRERGVELRFVVLAEVMQDSEPAWTEFLRANQQQGAPPLGTPRREPNEVLVELLEERGHRCWDLFDEVDRMGLDRARFIMGDNFHWSKPGHDVFARALWERIQAEGLVDELVRRRQERPRERAFGEPPFVVGGN